MVVEHESWDALVEEQLEYEERLSVSSTSAFCRQPCLQRLVCGSCGLCWRDASAASNDRVSCFVLHVNDGIAGGSCFVLH
eukprot:2743076-Lingulodinium_polyedra.AAC.1